MLPIVYGALAVDVVMAVTVYMTPVAMLVGWCVGPAPMAVMGVLTLTNTVHMDMAQRGLQ